MKATPHCSLNSERLQEEHGAYLAECTVSRYVKKDDAGFIGLKP